jgi:hypothetical protein
MTQAFHQEDADQIIQDYCGVISDAFIVPLVSYGNGETSDVRDKTLTEDGAYPLRQTDNMLYLSISFAEADCNGRFEFDKGACLTQFRNILNNCDTGGLFPKHGGAIEKDCQVYAMYGAGKTEPSPLFHQSDHLDLMGAFTCVDTDTSMLGPNSPLAGTCTCWYAHMTTVTDVFAKPDGGCGMVKSSQNPLTN